MIRSRYIGTLGINSVRSDRREDMTLGPRKVLFPGKSIRKTESLQMTLADGTETGFTLVWLLVVIFLSGLPELIRSRAQCQSTPK